MRYCTRILIYPKRIMLFDLTHIMRMANLVAIGVETSRINNRFSLEKYFNESLNNSIQNY